MGGPAGLSRECPGPSLGVDTYTLPVRRFVAAALIPVLSAAATGSAPTPPAPAVAMVAAVPDVAAEARELTRAARSTRRPVMAPAAVAAAVVVLPPASSPPRTATTAPRARARARSSSPTRPRSPARPRPQHRPASTLPAGAAAAIVAYAYAAVGRPYRFGAAGPGAYDCSGLVIAAAAAAGVWGLPHRAAALARVGRAVPPGEVRPGDIVILEGGGHAGVAIGGGMMIHASRAGRPVAVARIYATPTTVRRIVG